MSNVLLKCPGTGESAGVVGNSSGHVFFAADAETGGKSTWVGKLNTSDTFDWAYSIDRYDNPYNTRVAWDPANGKLITAGNRDPDYNGSLDVIVYRTNPATAVHDLKVVLTFEYPFGVISVTTDYLGNILVVGYYYYGAVGAVKLSASTGTVLWAKTYSVDGSDANFRVTGASMHPTIQTLNIVGTRTATQGYLLEIDTSTGAAGAKSTFTWPGFQSNIYLSIFRGPSNTPWVCGRGGIADPGNSVARSLSTTVTSAAVSAVFDGTNYFIAERQSTSQTKIHKLDGTFTGVKTISITGTGAAAAIAVTSAAATPTELLVGFAGGWPNPSYAFKLNKDLNITGTFDAFTIADDTPTSAPALTATFGSFTSTTTALTPTSAATAPIWVEDAPVTAFTSQGLVASTSGTVAGTLKVFTTQFAGANEINRPLPKITATITATNPTTEGAINRTLPKLGAALTLEVVPYGAAAATLPRIVSGFAGFASTNDRLVKNLPRVTATFEASVSGILETAITLPKIAAALEGGTQANDMALPAVTGSLTALTAVIGSIGGILPKPDTSIDAQATSSATMNIVLARVQSNVDAVAGLIGSITGLARPVAGAFEGATTATGGIVALLPAVEFSTSAVTTTYGSIGARLPRTPYGELVARMALVHALTHVMNTVSTAVTVFENYQFNSFAKIGGKYYAADATGLHLLDDGKLDETAAIQWAIQTGLLDFRSAMQKRMSDFYLAMRSEGDVTLTVSTDELDPYEYSLKPYEIETLKQRRDLIGKGMRGRYWQFGLSGDSDFDMDAYNMAVVDTARRI